jgi:hypothetical protein
LWPRGVDVQHPVGDSAEAVAGGGCGRWRADGSLAEHPGGGRASGPLDLLRPAHERRREVPRGSGERDPVQALDGEQAVALGGDLNTWVGQSSVVAVNGRPNASLHDVAISESARRFLAERLILLSREQLRDLFAVARVELLGETFEPSLGRVRTVDADD